MLPGVSERRSHDYIRHGTLDLLAALNTATGKVIGKLSARHRAVDFGDYLGDIDRRPSRAWRSTSSDRRHLTGPTVCRRNAFRISVTAMIDSATAAQRSH